MLVDAECPLKIMPWSAGGAARHASSTTEYDYQYNESDEIQPGKTRLQGASTDQLITLVADFRKSGLSVTPCFCAALVLMYNSRFLLVDDGMSPGFSPFRMRATILPV